MINGKALICVVVFLVATTTNGQLPANCNCRSNNVACSNPGCAVGNDDGNRCAFGFGISDTGSEGSVSSCVCPGYTTTNPIIPAGSYPSCSKYTADFSDQRRPVALACCNFCCYNATMTAMTTTTRRSTGAHVTSIAALVLFSVLLVF